jgi:hypothetical protein
VDRPARSAAQSRAERGAGSQPAGELDKLPFLQPDVITSSGAACAISVSTRGNTLRVQAASVEWGDRGTRLTPAAGHHS